jgi:diguanylate cyclase (GGDEF)-like protein
MQDVALWKRQVLSSLLAILAAVPSMAAIVALGHANGTAVAIWAPLSLALSVFAYLALHFGWSLRWQDPTLTLAQIVYSGTSVIVCYALAGPMGAVVLPMFCVAMLYAIFALPAPQVRWIAAYLLGLLGLVMVVMSRWQPERYPAAEQLVTFFQMCIVLPLSAVLAGRLSALRQRLGQQKVALREALERNIELAERDALTGLYNRRRASELLELFARQAARGQRIALAVVDIDHFKRVNDTHGHAAGDLVLQRFASEASATLRDGDILARWGGEEFLLLLPTGDVDSALGVAQRMRERTVAMAVTLPQGGTVAFTVSIGVAVLQKGEAASRAIERADAALYRAKANGRNCVEVG